MDFRIRENDGQGFFLTICPWQMPIFGLPSLTLPALIKSFVSVFVRGKCIFFSFFSVADVFLCFPSLTLPALIKFRVRPWPMYFFAGQLAKDLYR